MKTKLLPPVWFLTALLLMTGLHYFLPLGVLLPQPARFAGAVLVLTGFFIAGWAARAFSLAGTAIRPFEESTALVTTGLYRVTRNPMYLGMLLVLAGVALLFGTISPWLPVPLFAWLMQSRFIRHEEAMLERTFAEEYIAYKRKVRRWL